MAATTSKTIGLFVLIILLVALFMLVNPFSRIMFFNFIGGMPGMRWHLGGPGMMHGLHLGPVETMLFSSSAILFLFWLLVVVWVFFDAERKNMSGILWALLVLVGNIVGLIIYLIVRSTSSPRVFPVEETTKKTCPTCSKPVKDEFEMCPYCGANLKEKCPSCGKSVEADWRVCPYCGVKLKE